MSGVFSDMLAVVREAGGRAAAVAALADGPTGRD